MRKLHKHNKLFFHIFSSILAKKSTNIERRRAAESLSLNFSSQDVIDETEEAGGFKYNISHI